MGSPGLVRQLTTYSDPGFLIRRLGRTVRTCGVSIIVREAAQKAPGPVPGTPGRSVRRGIVVRVGRRDCIPELTLKAIGSNFPPETWDPFPGKTSQGEGFTVSRWEPSQWA